MEWRIVSAAADLIERRSPGDLRCFHSTNSVPLQFNRTIKQRLGAKAAVGLARGGPARRTHSARSPHCDAGSGPTIRIINAPNNKASRFLSRLIGANQSRRRAATLAPTNSNRERARQSQPIRPQPAQNSNVLNAPLPLPPSAPDCCVRRQTRARARAKAAALPQ